MSEEALQVARVEHLLDLGRLEQARSELQGLLETHPGDLMLRTLLARTQLDADDPTAALATARSVIRDGPYFEYAYRLAALAAARLGLRDTALGCAREAVELEPAHWRTHIALASVAVEYPEHRRLAWDAAGRAVELAPDEPTPHFLVGVAAQRIGDVGTARRAYERTLALQPGHALALNNLGVLQARRGRQRQAVAYYLDAAASDPRESIGRLNFNRLVSSYLRHSVLANSIGLGLLSGGGLAGAVFMGWVEAAALAVWGLVTVITLLRLPRRSRQALRAFRYRHRRFCRGAGGVAGVSALTVAFGIVGSPVGVLAGMLTIVGGLVLYFVSAPD